MFRGRTVGWAKPPDAYASGGVPTIHEHRDQEGGHGAKTRLCPPYDATRLALRPEDERGDSLNIQRPPHRLARRRTLCRAFSSGNGTFFQPMQSLERRTFPHRRGLIIVLTLATAYMASHFFRAANVTIGLDLMRDLSIGPEALGALTGAFFFGFASMQIPCGFLFDRFGPRRSVAGMLVAATLGGLVFTLAPSFPELLTGRVLMGCGFGVMLIGSMVVITRWFPADRF